MLLNTGITSRRNNLFTSSTGIRFFPINHEVNSRESTPAMSRASAFTRIGLLPSLVLPRVRAGDPGLASYLVVAN